MKSLPIGYVSKALFIDIETTGIAYGSDDPSYDRHSNKTYQSVAIGLIVADLENMEIIDQEYVEIKWDTLSEWSGKAEAVHGLSRDYLNANGMTTEDAVIIIAELILKHWGPTGVVCLGGHNVATFDKLFLQRILRSQGIEIKFGSKTIDTNAIGLAVFNTHNSDDLFKAIGMPPRDPTRHNALVDATSSFEVVRIVRSLFKECMG